MPPDERGAAGQRWGSPPGAGSASRWLNNCEMRASLCRGALVLFSPLLDVGVSGPEAPELERGDPARKIKFLQRTGSFEGAVRRTGQLANADCRA